MHTKSSGPLALVVNPEESGHETARSPSQHLCFHVPVGSRPSPVSIPKPPQSVHAQQVLQRGTHTDADRVHVVHSVDRDGKFHKVVPQFTPPRNERLLITHAGLQRSRTADQAAMAGNSVVPKYRSPTRSDFHHNSRSRRVDVVHGADKQVVHNVAKQLRPQSY